MRRDHRRHLHAQARRIQFKIGNIATETLLARLKPIEQTLQGMGNQLQTVVEELRGREVSWARIGEALGISRQSAWERFS